MTGPDRTDGGGQNLHVPSRGPSPAARVLWSHSPAVIMVFGPVTYMTVHEPWLGIVWFASLILVSLGEARRSSR